MVFCVYDDDLTLCCQFQSKVALLHASALDSNLFAVLDDGSILQLSVDNLKLLATKTPQMLSDRLTIFKVPQLLQGFKPTDLLTSNSKVMVPFNDGSIWEIDLKDGSQQVVGLRFMTSYTGDVPAKQINALDFMSVGSPQTSSATKFIIFGDVRGSLAVLKNTLPQFFELQFSNHKIASLKWLTKDLQFAAIT
jgi:hypothetical protein